MGKVSVIIPVYNVEMYIEECIRSVQSQDYEDIEIICVEDASIDNSKAVLERCAEQDARIKILLNEENRGLSYSRNRGMAAATGDYILFLDSDDMLMEHAVKELVQCVEENELDGVAFNMQYKIEGKEAEERFGTRGDVGAYRTKEQIVTGKELFQHFSEVHYWKVEACRYLWRRQFLVEHNLKFYEKIYYEDNLFSFQCWMKAQKIANINQEYYIYRRHGGTITSTSKYKHVESMFLVFMEIFSMWKSSDIGTELDVSMEAFLDHLYGTFAKKKSYFTDFQELSMGDAADKYMFSKLFFSQQKQRKYAFLSEDKLAELKSCEHVIVYGAGVVGIETIDLLEENGIRIDAVAVTSSSANASQVKGHRVCAIEELLDVKEQAIVILAVVEKYHSDINANLDKLGFENRMLLDRE